MVMYFMMCCIFCKNNSENSKSKEHIIPESIGNKEYVLPPRWVCDSCNNYFSRKVEAPFLESWYGKISRFEMRIPNKKGRIPVGTGVHPYSRTKLDLLFDKDGLSIFPASGEDETRFVKSIQTQRQGKLYIPSAGEPELNYEVARFIGKVGLEVLADRGTHIDGWNEELVNKTELDKLRNYVRRGEDGFIWPVNIRRIYSADQEFSDENNAAFQILNEFDILFIPSSKDSQVGEFYAIIVILGVEYAINLGEPDLDGYLQWLKYNDEQSYLYIKTKP